MSAWDITLGATGSAAATKAIKDGEDITNQISGIRVFSEVDRPTVVRVVYLASMVQMRLETNDPKDGVGAA